MAKQLQDILQCNIQLSRKSDADFDEHTYMRT